MRIQYQENKIEILSHIFRMTLELAQSTLFCIEKSSCRLYLLKIQSHYIHLFRLWKYIYW